MRLLSSLFALGVQFVLHVVRLPWRKAGQGERHFLASYGAEGLLPLSPDERRLLPALDRCIGCGLCNVVCAKLAGVPRHAFGGPSALGAQARSMPDFGSFASHVAHDSDCADCAICESVCPTGVPLRDLARFVSRHSRRGPG